jgi:mono/diheme cytochrome c family protein
MKRRTGRRALGAFGIFGMVMVCAAGYTELRWARTFDAEYPEIHASTDTEVIERGRYLVYGPAHCAACHAPPSAHADLERGMEVPLSGGFEWKIPLGTVRAPNITNDSETGVGRYTDGEIARVLRRAVKPNGTALLPFMEFQNISDEDLLAIVSYLRAAPGVRSEVAPWDLNIIGRGMLATVIRPAGPSSSPPVTTPAPGVTIERGEYLANRVAGCAACHSARNMLDGSYAGPRFAGGSPMPLDDDPSTVLVPPNLTPDPATGRITEWTADQFVARFRVGKLQDGTHMPWPNYARMSDDDLKAIHLYLMSLEPVVNDVGPIRRPAD